jgi:hypothetical protein
MQRLIAFVFGLVIIGLAAIWNSQQASSQGAWVTLLDGKNMGDWNVLGDANWRLEDGAVVTDKGNGFLVTKKSYKDFQIKSEFWVTPEANSGIHIRIQDPKKVSSKVSYEVNINDKRKAGAEYGTAAIPNVAKVEPGKFVAGNRWSTMEITARGPHIVVVFNGVQSVDVKNDMFAQGPFSLQGGGGIIKFRKVEVREF